MPAVIGLAGRTYTFESTYMYQLVNSNEGLPKFRRHLCLKNNYGLCRAVDLVRHNVMQRRAPRYAVVTGKAYRFRPVQLGTWRGPAVAFVACYFFVGQIFPGLVLVWTSCLPFLQPPSAAAFTQLSLRNYWDLSPDFILPALRNTVVLMVAVPTVTLVVSFAISWTIVKSNYRGRRIFDFFAFLPHTIPSIVFAIAAWLLSLFVIAKVFRSTARSGC